MNRFSHFLPLFYCSKLVHHHHHPHLLLGHTMITILLVFEQQQQFLALDLVSRCIWTGDCSVVVVQLCLVSSSKACSYIWLYLLVWKTVWVWTWILAKLHSMNRNEWEDEWTGRRESEWTAGGFVVVRSRRRRTWRLVLSLLKRTIM